MSSQYYSQMFLDKSDRELNQIIYSGEYEESDPIVQGAKEELKYRKRIKDLSDFSLLKDDEIMNLIKRDKIFSVGLNKIIIAEAVKRHLVVVKEYYQDPTTSRNYNLRNYDNSSNERNGSENRYANTGGGTEYTNKSEGLENHDSKILLSTIIIIAIILVPIFIISLIGNSNDVKENLSNSSSKQNSSCTGNEGCISNVRNNFTNTGKTILSEKYLGDGKFGISFLDTQQGEAFNATVLTDCNCKVISVHVSRMH